MMEKIRQNKMLIRNLIYTVIVYFAFRIMEYTNDTSTLVAIIFFVSTDLLIPMQETLNKIRSSEGTQ